VPDTFGSDSSDLPEVVQIAQTLIRFNTTNYGGGRSEGEHEAALYVKGLLEEVGLECQLFEPEPGRTNVVARWKGEDSSLPAWMIHGHLDVVPADPRLWSVDPFAGEIRDGMLWGRGAVDMKDMDAMILASVREIAGAGGRPPRDIVLAFFADEEAGCDLGSIWLVDNHPELFEGVTHAISEVGGYSVDISGKRAYLIQTEEKGLLWVRLRAKGRAGHGSIINNDNAITKVARAVVSLGDAEWPVSLTTGTADLLERVRELTASAPDATPRDLAGLTGAGSAWVTSSLQNVGNVTLLNAGYKENVVPEEATALIDVRILPGQREEVLARLQELVGPDIELTVEKDLISLQTEFGGPMIDAMIASLGRLDPEASALPYMLPGGTDNKALSRLGIKGYGFVPLKLPADFNFPGMFHGVDERVPLDALIFGQTVLTDLIRTY
jgi:acetylornithine deacetylase/succinyl-diaminopimelate desuccinylase-like protein